MRGVIVDVAGDQHIGAGKQGVPHVAAARAAQNGHLADRPFQIADDAHRRHVEHLLRELRQLAKRHSRGQLAHAAQTEHSTLEVHRVEVIGHLLVGVGLQYSLNRLALDAGGYDGLYAYFLYAFKLACFPDKRSAFLPAAGTSPFRGC